MSNKTNTKTDTQKFFKSRSGQEKYDAEIKRLREQRIRVNTWVKEQSKRYKTRCDERYE